MEALTAALLATVLVGGVGETVEAQVLVRLPYEGEVEIAEQIFQVKSNEVISARVPIIAREGLSEERIRISASGLVYELPLKVIGVPKPRKLWWLAVAPTAVALSAFRIKRKVS